MTQHKHISFQSEDSELVPVRGTDAAESQPLLSQLLWKGEKNDFQPFSVCLHLSGGRDGAALSIILSHLSSRATFNVLT